MLSKIKALPKLVAALAVAAALTFGATQALVADPPQCTPLPPHTCKYQTNPNQWCADFCGNNSYPPVGMCLLTDDCCICLEK